MRQNALTKEIHIYRLNGYSDHLHCLFGLNADMTVAKALHLPKGESAHWINKEKITATKFEKFEWADEYYAASVGESMLHSVRAYIDNQEEHHRGKSYAEEVQEFLRKYRFTGHG